MKQRHYRFVSYWQLPASRQTVAAVLQREVAWPDWWPGLEQATPLGEQRVALVWRSASGYRLALTLIITDYRPGEYIAFTSEGDLSGQGEFVFDTSRDQPTRITINWNVTTTKAWMNWLAPLLRPLFRANHDRLMAAGERGLAQYTAKLSNKKETHGT